MPHPEQQPYRPSYGPEGIGPDGDAGRDHRGAAQSPPAAPDHPEVTLFRPGLVSGVLGGLAAVCLLIYRVTGAGWMGYPVIVLVVAALVAWIVEYLRPRGGQ